MGVLLKVNEISEYIEDYSTHFNGFKTTQDRKYFIHNIFRNLNDNLGFKTAYYSGSNQIVLTVNDKEVYNSDLDNYTVNSFKIFIHGLIEDYIKKRDK